MAKYEDLICEAIDTIVQNAVANANFDRTIQATIISCENAAKAEYKVRYQDSVFLAYATNTEVKYSNNTDVYILIPGNNMDRPKTIIGTVKNLGIEYTSIVDEDEAYETVGTELISSSGSFELCSYNDRTVQILYDRDNNINLISINTRDAAEYLKQSDAVKCSAIIRTKLPIEQRYKGKYGIVYELDFKQSSGDIITKEYILDTNQMTGNPYLYTVNSNQYGIFELDKENFESIKRIYIFSYDFPITLENQPADIFISQIQLQGVNHISEENLNGVSLSIKAPQGTFFDNNDTDMAERVLEAQVKVKGKVVAEDSKNIEYYWFKEDLRVLPTSKNYNPYGGAGWYCINKYTEIDNNTVEWLTNNHAITITKQEFLAKHNKMKCVIVYNTSTVISKEIDIINYSSQYDISLISDAVSNTFRFDIGTPSLTCLINKVNITDNQYTYQWAKEDNNGLFELLNETTEDNNIYNAAAADLESILSRIATEQSWPAATKIERDSLQATIDSYDGITRVEKNKIFKIQIKDIVNYNIYKCAVYYNNQYIGSSSITLLNEHDLDKSYSLIIENGSVVFKYNAKGISPTHPSLENPMIINPLGFTLYDANGELIEEKSIKREGTILWKVPKKYTFIKIPPTYDTEIDEELSTDDYTIYKDITQLPYTIANNYSVNYINNEIELTIIYKDARFVSTTNFTFTKDGQNGTNGTDYVLRLVPNATTDVRQIVVTNGNLNFTPRSEGQWIRAQLWKDGELIYDNYVNGNSKEEKQVKIQWEILKNKYRYDLFDETALSIDKDNGYVTYLGFNSNNPANIIKCTITYNNIKYYATIPVITVDINNNYTINLKEGSGFQYAVYTTDGVLPSYNTTNPFELIVTQLINGYKEDITAATQSNKITYTWTPVGGVYQYDSESKTTVWKYDKTITFNEYKNKDLPDYQRIVTLASQFNGQCVTTGIIVTIAQDSTDIGMIHIPIHLSLNTYGNVALNDWDGNSIEINKDGGFILAPQIGAGQKNDDDNTFSGVLIGSVQEAGKTFIENGVFGYYHGQRSIFLDSDTGAALFGFSKSRITIDPTSNNTMLYSTKYWKNYNKKGLPSSYENSNKNYQGMLIDLSAPKIEWGNNNFSVNEEGWIHAAGGGDIAGFNINNYAIYKGKSRYLDTANHGIYLGSTIAPGENEYGISVGMSYMSANGGLQIRTLDRYGYIKSEFNGDGINIYNIPNQYYPNPYLIAKFDGSTITQYSIKDGSLTGYLSTYQIRSYYNGHEVFSYRAQDGENSSSLSLIEWLYWSTGKDNELHLSPTHIDFWKQENSLPIEIKADFNTGFNGIFMRASGYTSNSIALNSDTGRIDGKTIYEDGNRVATQLDISSLQSQLSSLNSTVSSIRSCSCSSESDARLKYDITTTDMNGLDVLNQIYIRQFNWVEDDEFEIAGFIADELEKVDPSLINKQPQYNKHGEIIDEIKEIKHAPLEALTIKAVQELYDQIDEQQQIITYLLQKLEINKEDIDIHHMERIAPEVTIEEYGIEYERSVEVDVPTSEAIDKQIEQDRQEYKKIQEEQRKYYEEALKKYKERKGD